MLPGWSDHAPVRFRDHDEVIVSFNEERRRVRMAVTKISCDDFQSLAQCCRSDIASAFVTLGNEFSRHHVYVDVEAVFSDMAANMDCRMRIYDLSLDLSMGLASVQGLISNVGTILDNAADERDDVYVDVILEVVIQGRYT